jgi:predicted DNA-binding protein
MATPRVLLRVEIPVELSDKLEERCKATGETKTAVTIAALENYLKEE